MIIGFLPLLNLGSFVCCLFRVLAGAIQQLPIHDSLAGTVQYCCFLKREAFLGTLTRTSKQTTSKLFKKCNRQHFYQHLARRAYQHSLFYTFQVYFQTESPMGRLGARRPNANCQFFRCGPHLTDIGTSSTAIIGFITLACTSTCS